MNIRSMFFSVCLAFAMAISLTSGIQAQTVLLIPDSGTDFIGAYDPFDGSLIDASFIDGSAQLATPINAIDSGRGTFLVSDQLNDGVFEYDTAGNYIGEVASNAVNQIDNVRGIEVKDGILYITCGGGTLTDTVQQIDLSTGVQATFCNVDNPFDILFRQNDVLVTNIDADEIDVFDNSGTFLSVLNSDMNFP